MLKDEKDAIITLQEKTIKKLEDKLESKIRYIKWLHKEYEKEHRALKTILNKN